VNTEFGYDVYVSGIIRRRHGRFLICTISGGFYKLGQFNVLLICPKCITFHPIIDFESELVDFNGEDDHVYLLVIYPPKVAISALVNSLKGVSSRMTPKKELSFDQK
jgi:hypothetical protein